MIDPILNLLTTYDADLKVWSGETEQNLYNDNLTIGQIIFRQLQSDPQRIFQISHSEKTRLTRSEMLHNSAKVSVYLRQQGLTTDLDMVGIIARNSTHLASVAYGCMFNGTVFHAVDPNIEEHVICNLYDITKPKLICCDSQDSEKMQNVAKKLGAKLMTISGTMEGVASMVDVLQTTVPEDFKPQSFERGIDRTMAILCSSGTTGIPKAVTVSNSPKMIDIFNHLTSNDVQYCPSSLDWVSGIFTLVTAAVYGTLRVISNIPFSPSNFLQMCEEHGITWALIGSTYFGMLVNCPEINKDQLKTLKHLFFGGGRTLESTLKKMMPFLSLDILRNGYALTELGTAASCNYCVDKKPSSVGRLLKNIKVRVVDEDGSFLGPNQVGEIYCHTGQYWGGYYGNRAATAEIQDDEGWFHTGDLGYFDDDNYLNLVDRKKDMLKYIHMIYYPNEIEKVIAQMPEVAEVCVFGIWNETEGDAAAAAVVLKAGCDLSANQVRDFVSQNISVKYKHLHGGAQIVSDLAKTANGKINRRAVKEEYLKRVQHDSTINK